MKQIISLAGDGIPMKSRTYTHQTIHSLSIVIPFFNEEESIALLHERLTPVIGELQDTLRVQLVLVDDGSTDNTFALLHQWFGRRVLCHCEILRHAANQGISAAMRTGFKAATGQVICTMDSDCSYPPDELIGMLRRLQEENADIVTVSPYHPAVLDNVSSHRLFLSRACSILYRFLVPEKLYCYTCLFRVYRREWARHDMFVSNGFLGVTEILLAAAYCGAAIVEYPARLGARLYGRSKMRTMQVIRDHLALLAKTAKLNLWLKLGGRPIPSASGAEMGAPLYALGAGHDALLSRMDSHVRTPLRKLADTDEYFGLERAEAI